MEISDKVSFQNKLLRQTGPPAFIEDLDESRYKIKEESVKQCTRQQQPEKRKHWMKNSNLALIDELRKLITPTATI